MHCHFEMLQGGPALTAGQGLLGASLLPCRYNIDTRNEEVSTRQLQTHFRQLSFSEAASTLPRFVTYRMDEKKNVLLFHLREDNMFLVSDFLFFSSQLLHPLCCAQSHQHRCFISEALCTHYKPNTHFTDSSRSLLGNVAFYDTYIHTSSMRYSEQHTKGL